MSAVASSEGRLERNRELNSLGVGFFADRVMGQLTLYKAGREVDVSIVEQAISFIDGVERGGLRLLSEKGVNPVPSWREDKRDFGYVSRAWIDLGICPVDEKLLKRKCKEYRVLLGRLRRRKVDPRSESVDELHEVFTHMSRKTLLELRSLRNYIR